jgi:phage tail-like protein
MADYYPPVAFHFRVEFELFNGEENEVRFQEVSGISMELETETYNEGGENRFAHKLPVRASYPDLVLKRGLLINSDVRQWIEGTIHNLNIQPTTVWVKVLNEEHEPLQTYTFINAYPKKWTVSDLNAQSSSLLIESLELSYQFFKISS